MLAPDTLAVLRNDFGIGEAALARLDDLAGVYAGRGLLREGQTLPLHDVCPHRDECWAECQHAAPPDDYAGISLPWIGGSYEDGRVLVVGINFHDWGGLLANWYVCSDHQRQQQAGRQGKSGHPFALAAMAYTAVVLNSLDGREVGHGDVPRPQDVAALWDRIAFLQGIKCAPRTNRSRPTDAMFANCPGFLLVEEIERLHPHAVILLGRGALRDAVRPRLTEHFGLEWGDCPGHLERDTFLLRGAPVQLFSLYHPSYPDWRKSLRQLVDMLGPAPYHEAPRTPWLVELPGRLSGLS
ncbi:MAG: uracil-DNA glycosylase family protein [Actinomycetota bacterium]|nr:uracil-DNA glycosylase family protein [Actinomycetota bacterium]